MLVVENYFLDFFCLVKCHLLMGKKKVLAKRRR
jgi:hypothetical protein